MALEILEVAATAQCGPAWQPLLMKGYQACCRPRAGSQCRLHQLGDAQQAADDHCLPRVLLLCGLRVSS